MNIKAAASNYVIEPAATPAIPIAGSDQLFPVHRVYCVGRNYAAHAVEMGHDPNKEPPFFFQKNADNLDTSGSFPYPSASNDVHHEIEMIVALKSGGVDIPVEKALDCVYGYGVGLDMTRRDLQGKAKDMGRPWEVGKAFEQSAPCFGAGAGREDRTSDARRDLAGRERRAQADWRPQPDDLEGSGNDQLSVRPVPPGAGDIIMSGHAGRRRRGEARRRDEGPCRRRRRRRGPRCLTRHRS